MVTGGEDLANGFSRDAESSERSALASEDSGSRLNELIG
jgi:hypothetical protein